MSRIDWSAAALGETVIPVVLIHGMPVILYPDGITITGLSPASPDSAWWPGSTLANWTDYARPWLMLTGDGVRLSESAKPSTSNVLDVSEVTVYLDDIDDGANSYAATALLSNASNITQTYLTASVSSTATTINGLAAFQFDGASFWMGTANDSAHRWLDALAASNWRLFVLFDDTGVTRAGTGATVDEIGRAHV